MFELSSYRADMGRLFLLAFFLSYVSLEPIIFKNCTGSSQTISVDIAPCPVQPCVVHHNVTATVRVTFKAPDDSSTLRADIYGIIAGVKIPWAMPHPDGCTDANITCPVTSGRIYTYTNTLAVPALAPKIRLVVEWSLTGSKGENQFCFDFPMEIS